LPPRADSPSSSTAIIAAAASFEEAASVTLLTIAAGSLPDSAAIAFNAFPFPRITGFATTAAADVGLLSSPPSLMLAAGSVMLVMGRVCLGSVHNTHTNNADFGISKT
jgi:hypothetical protein